MVVEFSAEKSYDISRKSAFRKVFPACNFCLLFANKCAIIKQKAEVMGFGNEYVSGGCDFNVQCLWRNSPSAPAAGGDPSAAAD